MRYKLLPVVIAASSLSGLCFAQPEPCASQTRPIESRDHVIEIDVNGDPVVFEVTRNLVPVIDNRPNAQGVRPFNPIVTDPCRSLSYLYWDAGAPGFHPEQYGAFRWRTDLPGGNEGEAFPSAGYHSMLFWDPIHVGISDWPFHPAHLPTTPGYEDPNRYFGFRSNANPALPLSIGDFMPRGTTLGQGSYCLVPTSATNKSTGWKGLSRPTLQDNVDLITGFPLAQVTDLELPLEGATFRLTRTRSSTPVLADHRWRPTEEGLGTSTASDMWWDWTGVGWMAGESPVLLVDSALPNVVGDNPRTTRLVLDAHHSIPFQLIESTGRYEAPPRFRATLRHNGDWNPASRAWATAPTEFRISLFEGEITYTFVVLPEDVPQNRWYADEYVADGIIEPGAPMVPSSYHDRPLLPQHFASIQDPSDERVFHDPWNRNINPGFGVPHIAICTKIADRNGHEVEFEYAASARRHMDDPATPDCIECMQDNLAKGQIKRILLKSRGEVKWTLVYAYRRFAGLNWLPPAWGDYSLYTEFASYDIVSEGACPENDPSRYELHGDVAIDRIYVYKGEYDLPGDDPSDPTDDVDLTVHHADRPGFTSHFSIADPTDPINLFNARNPTQLVSQGWEYQVQYHYMTCRDVEGWYAQLVQPDVSPDRSDLARLVPWYFGIAEDATGSTPVLLMTSVHTRHGEGAAATYATRHTAYVYEHELSAFDLRGTFPNPYWSAEADYLQLRGIVEDQQLRQLAAQHTPQPGSTTDRIADLVLSLAEGKLTPAQQSEVLRRAVVCFEPNWFENQPANGADLESLRANGYVSWYDQNSAHRIYSGEPIGVVKSFSVQEPSGNRRSYWVRRFIDPGVTITSGEEPQLSMWFLPYAWKGYWHSDRDPILLALPSLSEPRVVVVIDEFPSEGPITSVDYDTQLCIGTATFQRRTPSGALETATSGQLSRRVVYLNASGVVLKERRWDFTPSGTQVSGIGIGVDYVYKRVADLFGLTLAQDCAYVAGIAGVDPVSQQPYDYNELCDTPQGSIPASVGNQSVLVEMRSLGWSVAELNDLGELRRETHASPKGW